MNNDHNMTNEEIKERYESAGGPPRNKEHHPDHGMGMDLGSALIIAALVLLVAALVAKVL
jgi:hypothetical protein